jgi:hypothetical protein
MLDDGVDMYQYNVSLILYLMAKEAYSVISTTIKWCIDIILSI